jgi:hypothetical protein
MAGDRRDFGSTKPAIARLEGAWIPPVKVGSPVLHEWSLKALKQFHMLPVLAFMFQDHLLPQLAIVLLLASAPAGSAAPNTSTPLLVELFTSEGCSSCPPADALLRNLDAKQPVPGVQFIVLEEHVDYWDGDGWKDPFSSPEFTLRQSEYAQRLHVAEPYTPEMVVNGSFEFVGNDGNRAAEVFQKAIAARTVPIRISSAANTGGTLHAHVDVDPADVKAEIWIALAIDHAESQVLKGENGGHHLEHVAVLKKLSQIGELDKQRGFSKEISFKSMTRPSRLIAFLQEPGQGKIFGVTMVSVQP